MRLAFVLCFGAAVLFGIRSVYYAIYWSNPAHQFEALQPWMTPGYIAHSYRVDPHKLAEALVVPPENGRRPTLGSLAEAAGLPFADYAERVLQAIQTMRAAPNG
ncbi:MAG: hypothetical protein KGH84_02565 [Paracoccaceae bacterium]|nr:hypothetical protein [Paracoccaceae bacterium]